MKHTTWMRKPFLLSGLLLGLLFSASAQLVDPVAWSYDKKRVSETEVDLIFHATIDKDWYMYGPYFEDGGPVRYALLFEESDKFTVKGKIRQDPAPEEMYDDIFAMMVDIFKKKATLTQRVEIHSTADFKLSGEMEYQVCQDERCVMFTPGFSFDIKGAPETTQEDAAKAETKEQGGTPGQDEKATGGQQTVIPVTETEVEGDTAKTGEKAEDEAQAGDVPAAPKKEKLSAKQKTLNPQVKDRSLWGFFWISFLAGLLAIFTPCVFPMIPMTVTFFMKSSDNKVKGRFQASVYGLSIIAIYTLIGTIVALAFGASFANWLSTHWLPNTLFFLIFLLFAISFMGAFEITMPGWLINKADSKSDKGGVTGAFFMAFTLVLVSFSCTGPLVGAILVQSAGGEILMPVIGMFGFSLAFALPFTVFAFFPSLLSGMPKSGGWLNTVKVSLGFIELALGLKFLSIADQTYHWGILDRHIYLALWIVIFAMWGFYLLGKLRMPGDSKLEHVSITRVLMSVVIFSFVVYMIPGLWGAPLKALSGYLPPQTTQDFDISTIVRNNMQAGAAAAPEDNPTMCGEAKYHEKLHLPHGLKGYFDYEEGLACAKNLNKPILLDFTGHGCVNCREMEARVWADPRVLSRLKNDYVLVSLYVDDKTKLPEEDWITSEVDGKVKKTIGRKYADYQISRFGVNAQPYYVLLDTNGELLVEPKAYDLNVDNFVAFLDSGKAAFNNPQ